MRVQNPYYIEFLSVRNLHFVFAYIGLYPHYIRAYIGLYRNVHRAYMHRESDYIAAYASALYWISWLS